MLNVILPQYTQSPSPTSFKGETNAVVENVITLQAWEISVQGYLFIKCSEWQWIDEFDQMQESAIFYFHLNTVNRSLSPK